MTNFIHTIAYIGIILLLCSLAINVIFHVIYKSRNSDKKSFKFTSIIDYTFTGIIIGFVLVISSELLKIIYGI